MTSAVVVIPVSAPFIITTRGQSDHISRTLSVVRPWPSGSVATIEWTCMIVVGTATANELIWISGLTVITSGPWWLGTFNTGLIALIGPFFESPGSAALRIIVHSTDNSPQCS